MSKRFMNISIVVILIAMVIIVLTPDTAIHEVEEQPLEASAHQEEIVALEEDAGGHEGHNHEEEAGGHEGHNHDEEYEEIVWNDGNGFPCKIRASQKHTRSYGCYEVRKYRTQR